MNPGLGRGAVALALLLAASHVAAAQSGSAAKKPVAADEGISQLKRDFFAALRAGDSHKLLSYVPPGGINVGPAAQHLTREEVEQQFQLHHGLYCRLFDSTCIDAPIPLDNSARACSYRELLTHSRQVRTAASAMTRNGVRQAVLVARVHDAPCPNDKLIDVIFNLEAGVWKLFSLP